MLILCILMSWDDFMFRYLQEFAALGTGGGIYHFRDQILSGGPAAFFLMNADVCSEFPLEDMLRFHRQREGSHCGIILGTTVKHLQTRSRERNNETV